MSTAMDNKFTVDSEKLKEILNEKGVSLSEASIGCSHNRSWLSQRMRGKEHFVITDTDAMQLGLFLSCGIQDFAAPGENLYFPIAFDYPGKFKAAIDKMPSQYYPLADAFFDYIDHPTGQKIEDLFLFLKRPAVQVKPKCSIPPELWFQEYLAEEAYKTLYDRFRECLPKYMSILKEDVLCDTVWRKFRSVCHDKRCEYTKGVELVHKYLRENMQDLETVVDETVDALIRTSANFLVEYINDGMSATMRVATLKERLKDSENSVPRSDVT